MSLDLDHPTTGDSSEKSFGSGGTAERGRSDAVACRAPVKLNGWPLLGVLPELRADPLYFLTRVARDYGDAIELNLGAEKILMLNSPALIRHVLQDNRLNYEKSEFYHRVRHVGGGGIFLAEGDDWLAQRKTAGRSFQGCQLRRMTETMHHAVGDLGQRWAALAERRAVIDVIPEMMHLTLDILMRALFSLRLVGQHEEVFHALTVILRDAQKRVWSLLNTPNWLPTRRNREVGDALASLDRFMLDLIAACRAAPSREDESQQDLLDLLLANQNGRSDRQLCGQIRSLILAGHETTANALTWCWALLSLNPQSLRRLRGEARAVLNGRPAGIEDLPALKYTRMVFDETLRLYPTLWNYSRIAVADDSIAGLDIAAGSNVMLNTFAVHRRPQLWDNPEGFDPERFNPDTADADKHTAQRFAYFPFSAGPRTCLGDRFAILESMIALTALVQRFDLQLLPGQKVEPEPMITLRPRGPLLMRVCPTPAT